MSTVVVTGAHGLVGSEAVAWFCERGHDVVGIDNDMRARFFGVDASTAWQGARLVSAYPKYRAVDADIRDLSAIERVFEDYSSSIDLWSTRRHNPRTTGPRASRLQTSRSMPMAPSFCSSAPAVWHPMPPLYSLRPTRFMAIGRTNCRWWNWIGVGR